MQLPGMSAGVAERQPMIPDAHGGLSHAITRVLRAEGVTGSPPRLSLLRSHYPNLFWT